MRYRHMDTAAVAYADGHAKAVKAGAVKWYESVYINVGRYPYTESWYPY
ncbi:MAG: hypothetical protein EON94_04365 [Caulobacteraceae bacterium]|nr:MAG: hypothetical protein EON94_04365 [Caulobacteraceae bacterium]